MGSASADAAVLAAIENDIQGLLKSNPGIFSFKKIEAGSVDIRDFQTTGVVAFAKGLPFSRLVSGKQTINGHRVQVKQEYLINSINSPRRAKSSAGRAALRSGDVGKLAGVHHACFEAIDLTSVPSRASSVLM